MYILPSKQQKKNTTTTNVSISNTRIHHQLTSFKLVVNLPHTPSFYPGLELYQQLNVPNWSKCNIEKRCKITAMRRRSTSSILPIPKVQSLSQWPLPELLILIKIRSIKLPILIKIRSIKLLILIIIWSIELLILIILLILIKPWWWWHCSIGLLIMMKRLTWLRRRQLSINMLIRMDIRRWCPRPERSKSGRWTEISIGFTNRIEVRVSSYNVLFTSFAGRTVRKVSPATAPASSKL